MKRLNHRQCPRNGNLVPMILGAGLGALACSAPSGSRQYGAAASQTGTAAAASLTSASTAAAATSAGLPVASTTSASTTPMMATSTPPGVTAAPSASLSAAPSASASTASSSSNQLPDGTASSSASAAPSALPPDAGVDPNAVSRSEGCGGTPTLMNSPGTSNFSQNTVMVAGKSRDFIVRWPTNYDSETPYRLIIGLHGATGRGEDVAGNPAYFGLWALAEDSTIFVAPSAVDGLWSAADDTMFVDEILKAVEADLCIDKSRIFLEGFSQGAAMSWTLACSNPGVFRAVVGHSGGGVAKPSSCEPVAYFGSGGLQENVTQTTQSDPFASWNDCSVETFPSAPGGGHICSDYEDCSAGHPVRWCNFDGPHTPSPTDSGGGNSWMPAEVWSFISQF
jgi:poly(3-hydroxybutyrate) depolymerase